MTIREANSSEIGELTGLLVRAFDQDPVLRYLIPQDNDWQRAAPRYFSLVLHNTLKRGYTTVEGNGNGVALWEPPDATIPLPRQLINLAVMTKIYRRNLAQVLRVQAATQKYKPRRPCWYLTYIATDPDHQRTGIGQKLLQPIVELAESNRQPVYLECSNELNLPFYFAQGFNLVEVVQVPDGPKLWPMLRESR